LSGSRTNPGITSRRCAINIIAEIGINHNGDLSNAFKLMCMAKKAGADYVKFQKRDINTVYTQKFLDSPRESPWGNTQRHQKEGLEFNLDEYREIDKYSKKIELPWFASSWDILSLHEMESFDPPFHKIASPMTTNRKFVEEVCKLGRKTLVSCGATHWEDIDWVYDTFKLSNTEIVLMHCVSEYPCPDEHVNLGMIHTLKARYPGAEIGYSNHSAGIESCVGAAYLGAQFIECHITLDRSSYGSDQAASLERRGLELVVKYAKNANKIIGDGIRIIREAERANAAKMRYWEIK
jgi:N-acetylneuraminate synthase